MTGVYIDTIFLLLFLRILSIVPFREMNNSDFSCWGLPQSEAEVMKHQILLQASHQHKCVLDRPVWQI